MDLIASLCNIYDTSEDEVKKRMEEGNTLITEILKKNPCLASESKSENLENIFPGLFENFLTCSMNFYYALLCHLLTIFSK